MAMIDVDLDLGLPQETEARLVIGRPTEAELGGLALALVEYENQFRPHALEVTGWQRLEASQAGAVDAVFDEVLLPVLSRQGLYEDPHDRVVPDIKLVTPLGVTDIILATIDQIDGHDVVELEVDGWGIRKTVGGAWWSRPTDGLPAGTGATGDGEDFWQFMVQLTDQVDHGHAFAVPGDFGHGEYKLQLGQLDDKRLLALAEILRPSRPDLTNLTVEQAAAHMTNNQEQVAESLRRLVDRHPDWTVTQTIQTLKSPLLTT